MSITYKPVLPSSLLEQRVDSEVDFTRKVNRNMYLKLGTIVDVIDTDAPKNQSEFMVEYDVMVIEDDNTSIYKNCISIDSFGGVADFLRYKRRAHKDPKKVKDSGSFKKQNGSMVLLLCLEANGEIAIILGGLPHSDKGKILDPALGHHLEGEFNGINWQIDKDGQFVVTFKSATEADGKVINADAGGAYYKMEKDGSIEVSDGNKEKIRIDKTDKTIDIEAESDISNITDENFIITAKKDVQVKADAKILLEAGGSALFKSKADITVEAMGPFTLKAPNITIDSGGVTTVKASAVQIQASSIQLGSGGGPALTSSLQVLGTGYGGTPVISSVISGFSSTVFIA
jgi:hypothetical protein